MYLKHVKERYQFLCRLLNLKEDAQPCSIDDINRLEQHLGLRVPTALQEFLLWIGQGASYFDSDNCRLSDVWDGRQTAQEIMQEFGFRGKLPDDAIVFFIPQEADKFGFIRASEGGNPPIHIFFQELDGGQIEWNYAETIKDYLLQRIEGTIRLYSRMN